MLFFSLLLLLAHLILYVTECRYKQLKCSFSLVDCLMRCRSVLKVKYFFIFLLLVIMHTHTSSSHRLYIYIIFEAHRLTCRLVGSFVYFFVRSLWSFTLVDDEQTKRVITSMKEQPKIKFKVSKVNNTVYCLKVKHTLIPPSVYFCISSSRLSFRSFKQMYDFGFRCAIDQYGDRHKTFSCLVFFFFATIQCSFCIPVSASIFAYNDNEHSKCAKQKYSNKSLFVGLFLRRSVSFT